MLRAHASATLADVLADTGRYDEALDRARAALADTRALGDRRTEMHVLCVLGAINRREG